MKGVCFLCGKHCQTEAHHIFGAALRKKSEKYGLVVDLCHNCHNEPPMGVHFNAENMQILHEWGQRKWMHDTDGTIEDFRREFYKNYL